LLRPGTVVGSYALIERIGSGSFGEVWKAEKKNTVSSRAVAIKFPKRSEVNRDHIESEARNWERASGHPNVVLFIEAIECPDPEATYSSDPTETLFLIVSEYIQGGSLEKWLDRNDGKSPTIESAIKLMTGILLGLNHLHQNKIIHRDLKPANILLQEDNPRLVDFGLSRVISSSYSSRRSGTLLYMAPEAFHGKRTVQTDIWAAGVMLYQMLTGKFPFIGDSDAELMYSILESEPQQFPKSVPESLERIIFIALAKEPSQRYSTSLQMLEAVRAFDGSKAEPDNEPEPLVAAQIGDNKAETSTPQAKIETFPPSKKPLGATIQVAPARVVNPKRSNMVKWIFAVLGMLICVGVVVALINVTTPNGPGPTPPGEPASWSPGKEHPKYPNVFASETKGSWIPAPGYDWVNLPDIDKGDLRVRWAPGKEHPKHHHVIASETERSWDPAPGHKWFNKDLFEVSWSPGQKHPKYSNVEASITEHIWEAAPGYTFVNPDDKNDLRAIWSPGKEHSKHSNVIASETEGSWDPAPGHKWVNKDLFLVSWSPGQKHLKHPNVVAAESERNWVAAPGYKWINPDDKDDLRVIWLPGKEHSKHPHVRASQTERLWEPAPGYRWVNQNEGELRDDKSDLRVCRCPRPGFRTKFLSRTTSGSATRS